MSERRDACPARRTRRSRRRSTAGGCAGGCAARRTAAASGGLARRGLGEHGVSATRGRTNRPTASSTMLSRNGIRQPQARNACSPVSGGRGRQDQGGEHHAAGRAGVGEAGPQAAPGGGVLGGHQHGAAPLAADRDALHDAQQHQQDRRPHADLGVGGQQADQGAADAHQRHAQHEHLLAADPVAEVAEQDAARAAGRSSRWRACRSWRPCRPAGRGWRRRPC